MSLKAPGRTGAARPSIHSHTGNKCDAAGSPDPRYPRSGVLAAAGHIG